MGSILEDEYFEKELAKRFSVPLINVQRAITKFYLFSSKYDASITSKHHIHFKHVDGTFNAKPYLEGLAPVENKGLYHNISVLNHAKVLSVLQGSAKVCWAMLLKYLELEAPNIISAGVETINVPTVNAFSKNLCTAISCPKPVQTLTKSQIQSSVVEGTVLYFSRMEIVDSICRLTEIQCYEHCEKSINTEYNKCAYIQSRNSLGDLKKLETDGDPFQGRFCDPDRESQSLCLVFKQTRNVQSFPVYVTKLWSIHNFKCMQHTRPTRKFLRRKCFESNECNSYATNNNIACMLDSTGSNQNARSELFTHVYSKAQYDEARQRIRVENVHNMSSSASQTATDVNDCKQRCYGNPKCYAWQMNLAVDKCTLMTTDNVSPLNENKTKVSIDQECAKQLMNTKNNLHTCLDLNNRLNHKEVNKFWRETCCQNSNENIFPRLAAMSAIRFRALKNLTVDSTWCDWNQIQKATRFTCLKVTASYC